MRGLVDARLLNGGGIGRYIREIVSRWLRDGRLTSLHLLGPTDELERWLASEGATGLAATTEWRDPPYSPVAQLRWAAELHRHSTSADFTFFPHYDVPLVRHPARSLVAVHDLTHIRFPSGFPWWKRAGAHVLLRGALGRARAVLTVSEHTRRDLGDFLSAPADAVHVVPNGVDPGFRPLAEAEVDAARARFRHLSPFLLMVGACRPHKNCGLGIQLLARSRVEHPELRLVIAGEQGERAARLMRQAREAGVADAVDLLGAVDDAELRWLYGLAAVVLVPSFYEGFGLPALEAMACGAPVLVASRASLPEVVGEAAPRLDPSRIEAWVAETERVLGDGSLRRSRAAAGIERAAAFSWDRCADRTLELALAVAAG